MKKPILTLLLILTTLPLHAAEKPAWKEAVAAIDAGNLAPMQTLADAGDAAPPHNTASASCTKKAKAYPPMPRQPPRGITRLRQRAIQPRADVPRRAGRRPRCRAGTALVRTNRSAAYNLGNHYRYGLGVVQDYQQARQWYEKAAAQDNADAKKALQTW